MPKGATLSNTARKEIIDEESVLKFMQEIPDFTFISDIKPSTAATFNKDFPGRFFFTPQKMSAKTKEANLNAGIAAAPRTLSFLINDNSHSEVN